jgi:hypothetical protein
MSKVSNLTEITELEDNDLLYVIDSSEGPNGSRKITKSNLKQSIIPEASSVPYNNEDSNLTSNNVKTAIDEVDQKATKSKNDLISLQKGFLQYSNAVQQSTGSIFSTLNLSTDLNSVPNSLFTKSSASNFTTNFEGYVKISYKVDAFPDSNDRGVLIRVNKNSSAVPSSLSRLWGKSQIERSGTGTCSIILPCSINDVFSLQFASAESGHNSTVPASSAIFLIETYLVS